MSRYDHTDPKMGTYRATLAAATDPNDLERLIGVGHDANGLLVKGAGQTGVTAVWVATKVFPAGKRVDPMTNGQIVEFGPTSGEPGVDFGRKGSVYYSDANGNIETGVDEKQTITVTSTASPFTVTVGTHGTTASIPGTATAVQVHDAIAALSGIEDDDVIVTGPVSAVYTVEFTDQLGGEDIPAMTPGTNCTIATTQAGGTTTGLTRIGHTVERGDRLIVRVRP